MVGRACAVVAALGFASVGCAAAQRVEPGLANAPEWPPPDTRAPADVHDVVANGQDSCPRARVIAGDPLRFRYPPCPGFETPPPGTLPPTFVSLPPEQPPTPTPTVLWNVHLRGLPPCSGRDERGKELAMAVCASEPE